MLAKRVRVRVSQAGVRRVRVNLVRVRTASVNGTAEAQIRVHDRVGAEASKVQAPGRSVGVGQVNRHEQMSASQAGSGRVRAHPAKLS